MSGVFTPGPEWVDVPPGAVLPAGCEIEMNMTGGQPRARRVDADAQQGDLETFLTHFRPDSAITFVAITPGGGTTAKTFNGASDATTLWIENSNARGRGVYFTVNPTSASMAKKPRKHNITGIAAVWADLDPRDDAGHVWADERERLAALADELRALPWPPTLIIDSGNGLQPIWLLEDPIESTPEYQDAAEDLCARIEAALGAKGTHNVDRLLRVPGTRNYPNERKRALGRGETQAKLLDTEWQHYSWADLEKLADHLESNPPMHAVPLERTGPTKQKAPGTVIEIDLVDLLPADTPDPLDDARLDELRASHPEVFDLANYDGDQSRQDLALANVACKLGWPPADAWALIIAVRSDDKATRRRDYAARTLRKAYDKQDALNDGKGDALYDFSDDGLALDMGRKWQLGARHVALWRSWMFWDGTVWQRDETLLSHTRSREYLRARADALVRDTKSGKIKWGDDLDLEKALKCAEALAKSLRTKSKVSAVVELARSNPELVAVAAQWDADLWQLNTPGGIIDLRTGVVMPHTPYAYHTKITAVAPGGACPLWLKFLDRVTGGNVQLQAYLKHSAGYALTGSTREHVLQFLYGTGANGKGVFLNTIVGIMADYARVATMETFTATTNDRHPTDLAMLRGARLVTAQETEQGRRWAEAKIKSLTGGDPITARFLYQDNFTFVPQFKLQIAGNHRPGLTGVDEAVRRRFHLVPFDQTIPEHERDHELSNKLKAEWPGILAWMLEGCLEWQKIGLSPPEIVRAATDNYLTSEDSFERWRDECTEPDPHAWELAGDLWRSYRDWAESAGERPGTQKRFAQLLVERLFVPHRESSGAQRRGYLGARLTHSPTAAQAQPPTSARTVYAFHSR